MKPLYTAFDVMAGEVVRTNEALNIAIAYLEGLAKAHPNKSVEIRDKLFEIAKARTAPMLFCVEDDDAD